jgi:hypothetical protein
MYDEGLEVVAVEDAEVLADVWWPYFNRTWEHFCSHAQTPSDKPSVFPGAVRRGNVIYFAHPIFSMYMRHGVCTYKQLVLNALGLLLPEPLVRSNAPSTAHLTLLHQAAQNRHVLHVLHYIPERRYRDIHTIEDVIPIRGVQVGVMLEPPAAVYLAPSRKPLNFIMKGKRVWVEIPEVNGHAMVVFEAR